MFHDVRIIAKNLYILCEELMTSVDKKQKVKKVEEIVKLSKLGQNSLPKIRIEMAEKI